MWINIKDVLYNLDHYSHIYVVEGPDYVKLKMYRDRSDNSMIGDRVDIIEFDSTKELDPVYHQIANLTNTLNRIWDHDLANNN